jgi:hypothetical protein
VLVFLSQTSGNHFEQHNEIKHSETKLLLLMPSVVLVSVDCAECHNEANYADLIITTLNVAMLSVFMLSIVTLNAVTLSVIMLNFIMSLV